MSKTGIIILRIGLALVFIYFGVSQIIGSARWIGLLPDFLKNSNLAVHFIYANGFFDVLVALFLLWGKFLRVIAVLGVLHLLNIVLFSLGVNSPSGIRDLGLAFALASLFFLRREINKS